jgi:hypothetical protein
MHQPHKFGGLGGGGPSVNRGLGGGASSTPRWSQPHWCYGAWFLATPTLGGRGDRRGVQRQRKLALQWLLRPDNGEWQCCCSGSCRGHAPASKEGC